MDDMTLSEEVKSKQAFGEAICEKLGKTMAEIGFAKEDIPACPDYHAAEFQLVKDPYTGKNNLQGCWYDERNRQRVGQLQFQSDGSCYAEYDVVKEHPSRKKFFVEAVAVWGKAESLTAEARLLPMPD